MRKDELIKMADQVEDALVRAEEAKKDLDLIVALRGLLLILQDSLRHWENEQK